ncbi:MAG: ABC transporter permease [Actinomycetaceae bacterium]|nr:ABC transporter permease [Actinomycetaceae bacterium]
MTTATEDREQKKASGSSRFSFFADRSIGEFLMDQRAFIVLIVLVIVFAALSSNFLSSGNLLTMTRHVAYNALLSLGMLLVIITGGIDLSVGATLALSTVVAGELLGGVGLPFINKTAYPSVVAVVIICMLVGAFVGWINGQLITRFNIAPFIATLGTMYMARGTAQLISNGATYPHLQGDAALGNTGFSFLGSGKLLGLPTQIWIMILIAIIVWFILNKSPFGTWLYATGGNARAAGLSGVPVRRVTVRVYVISGTLAALAGLIIASELTSGGPQLGTSFEMNAIAAVVIGGASLAGGRGNVKGALIGAFVIGFLSDGLTLVGISTFWQTFIKGLIIVLAVMLDQAQERLKNARAAAAAAASVRAERGEPTQDPDPEPEGLSDSSGAEPPETSGAEHPEPSDSATTHK